MEIDEVEKLCDQMRDQIQRGPGKDAEALRQILSQIQTLRSAATWTIPRHKLTDLEHNVKIWYSTRRWVGTDGTGDFYKRQMFADLSNVERTWVRKEGQGGDD